MQQRVINCNHRQFSVILRDQADESVANEIFKFREYRLAEEIIRTAANPIVDVGAHSGLFVLYARSLNPTVSIVAIEPEKNNLALLKRHLKDNAITGVQLVEGALASKSGKRQLIISSDSHNHRLLDTVETPRRHVGASSRVKSITAPINAYSLSDLCRQHHLKKISLLKMDIEGGEYEIFETLGPEEFKKIQTIIMEYHSSYSPLPEGRSQRGGSRSYKEIEQKLRENGFSVQIHPSHFDKTMGFLFARNKRN